MQQSVSINSTPFGSQSPGGGAPLAGLRVIEFCNVAAGPYCGMLLGDMGADVVKVEPPKGDMLRQWPPHHEGFSENFASLNRNKRSIALDLKDPTARSLAEELILSSDVVIENNRPGVMARLGLGYEAFADRRPRLIYCSLSAFGQDGPRAAEGGFDLTVQALSGIMSVTGEPGGEPVKCGAPVSDFVSGLYAAFAIAALAAQVRAGGQGGWIDVSMLGASLAISALQVSEYFGTGRAPGRHGAAHPRNAPYQAFSAADGRFVLAAGNDHLWNGVCQALERPDLAEDPRFQTTAARAEHQTELAGLLQAQFSERACEELLEAFRGAGVPCGRINSYDAALADPQVEHSGWVQDLTLPSGRVTRTLGSIVRIDGEAAPIRSGPPALDGDRQAILDELAILAAKT